MRPALLILLLVCSVARGASLDSIRVIDRADTGAAPSPDTLHPWRLATVGVGTLGGVVLAHGLLGDLWYKGEPAPFHFEWEHDWRYALGADKLGHAFFPYLTSGLLRGALRWSGLDSTTALWSASAVALAYQTWLEIRDGNSAAWGFSWGDEAANLIGAALPILQRRVEPFQLIRYRISFAPSSAFARGEHRVIIDDYESARHWLAFRLHDILPTPARDFWPSWLAVAVGHGVRGLDGEGGGEHELYLALDLDPTRLPGDGWVWDLVRDLLDYYHLPMPAVRLAPDVAWFGLRL